MTGVFLALVFLALGAAGYLLMGRLDRFLSTRVTPEEEPDEQDPDVPV